MDESWREEEMSTFVKSDVLIAAERELARLEATIAAENARRDAERREQTASMERMRAEEELRARQAAKLQMASVHLANSSILPRPPSAGPLKSGGHTGAGVPQPPIHITGSKELPEPALLLLRELWMRLGYEGTQFVGMQMEIGKELDTGDFARFEREMLCNEILAQRTEINKLRAERAELLRRNAATKDELADVVAAEGKTFRALLSEREAAQRELTDAQEAAYLATADAENEAHRFSVLSEEMERLERERVAAIMYGKQMEDKLASMRPPLPRRTTATATGAPAPASTPAVDTTIQGWTARDEAGLNKKLHERELAAEDARLAAEEKRVAAERAKARMEVNRLAAQTDSLGAAADKIRSEGVGRRAEAAGRAFPTTPGRQRRESMASAWDEPGRRSAWDAPGGPPHSSGPAGGGYGSDRRAAAGNLNRSQTTGAGRKMPGGW